MSLKSDFKDVLLHKDIAKIPFSVKFTVESLANYKRYLNKAFDPILDTGSYVVASHSNNGWKEIKPGFFEDYFGVVWNKTVDKTLGVVDVPILKEPSLKAYQFPNAENLPLYHFIEQNNKKYPEHFHMASIGFTLFERAWSLTGMPELMMYLLTEPEFVHDLLDKITEYNLKVIDHAAQLGVDCIHTADDWGAQNGLLISRDMWLEFIKPRFKKTCEHAKNKGLLLSHHSCGNINDLIPDMIDCGVDVFDPFQPEAMNIWDLRKKYKGKIAFWGGLSVQKTLPYGSPAEVENETRRLLQEMAPGGGYILSPSHSLTGDIPAENIATFLRVANNQ